MSEFYDDMQAVATELLTEFGSTIQFTRSEDGVYDPATGTAAPVVTNFTGIGVVTTYRSFEVDGERILQGDKKLTMEAMVDPPQIGDVLDSFGENYQVIGVMPINPAGTIIGYRLQIRV